MDPELIEVVMMGVEERFGITPSGDEIIRAETPGQLIDLVYGKVEKAGNGECLTSRAFYLVRRALMEELKWHRSQIVPSARREDLVPRKKRRETWQRLRAILQAK